MSVSPTGADDYVLGRDMFGSVRLDAQHLLWKLHSGYTLHPKIPISLNMEIAEIGTGTGASAQTVRLDGYDISDSQYPPQAAIANNMSLSVLDSFGDVPPHLAGKYDVVHLRFWCCVVKGNDPSLLIRHAVNLLKPGGYVQWEDAHLGRNLISGKVAEDLGRIAQTIFKAGNIIFDWVGDIGKHVQEMGLNVIDCETRGFRPSLVPLCTKTYLMGHFELFQVIQKLRGQQVSIPSEKECQQLLLALFKETKRGAVYHWSPVTLLAIKPSANN